MDIDVPEREGGGHGGAATVDRPNGGHCRERKVLSGDHGRS